jgi:hypothetical protein
LEGNVGGSGVEMSLDAPGDGVNVLVEAELAEAVE